MSGKWTTPGVVGLLLALIFVGGGVLVWLAPIPAEEMTPAREKLIEVADWMIKASAGAIMGFAVSRLTSRRNGAG